jgi:hypothetical protein
VFLLQLHVSTITRLQDTVIERHVKAATYKTSYNKSPRDALFFKFILIKNSTGFGQIYCPSSGVA